MKRDVQCRVILRISDEDAEKLQVKNIDFSVAFAQLRQQVDTHTAL
jgi:hypothetical protein